MNQLTIRALDGELEAALRQTAKEHHTSLNKAALLLLRQGAGLESRRREQKLVGNRLDRYIGSWSPEEAAIFEKAIEPLGKVDPDLWQ